MTTPGSFQYDRAGVDTSLAQESIRRLARHVEATFAFRSGEGSGRPVLPLGAYANVLDLGGNRGLAVSMDGVGTKLILAAEAGRFDTVGIDCIAMNVNDILCVGAEPAAMLDYIAVGDCDPAMIEAVAAGLRRGAEEARITIPGGELAQVREMLAPHGPSAGFDLVGTAVGFVDLDRIVDGRSVRPGDVLVGLGSNGLHSNGYTLARRVLFGAGGLRLDDRLPELDATLGEVLLRPTTLYVRAVVDMLRERLPVKMLAHITGDGLSNLLRLPVDAGLVIDRPLPAPPIFDLIQRVGGISTAEMYTVFNMGMGFCVTVAQDGVDAVLAAAERYGHTAAVVGRVVAEHPRRLAVPALGIGGTRDRLESTG